MNRRLCASARPLNLARWRRATDSVVGRCAQAKVHPLPLPASPGHAAAQSGGGQVGTSIAKSVRSLFSVVQRQICPGQTKAHWTYGCGSHSGATGA